MEKIVLTRISIKAIKSQLQCWLDETFDVDNIKTKDSWLDLLNMWANVYDMGLYHNNVSDDETAYYTDNDGNLYYFDTILGYFCGIDNTIIEKQECIIENGASYYGK